MADYGQGGSGGPRPNQYGHASNYEREAAFSNIFGAAPPPGRSQTMNSSVSPPPASPMNQVRTQTMSSQPSASQTVMQRQPPPRPGGYPSPPPGTPNGGMTNGYH